ncbi:MAG: GHMP kinase [Candidatus Aminicenantes bacterium]|nr:GHMP kinase [Candidatus Aminicenantes bacterium]
MWRIEIPSRFSSPDVDLFLKDINRYGFFEKRPLVVTRAPGRLDLMGGIADYSGSLVMQLSLAAAVTVAAQADQRPVFRAKSLLVKELEGRDEVEFFLESLLAFRGPGAGEKARELLTKDPSTRWAAYAAGALVILQREIGASFSHGVRLLIHSNVPPGKGISSSAALEVSVMRALCALFGISLDGPQTARLCQMVENEVVGAPCGIMDQMTAACGEKDRLLRLLCQPDKLKGYVPLPPGTEVWGIDSGIRHEVSGADYGSVRTGAFMGYRIIAHADGLPVKELEAGHVSIDDSAYKGYLANISVSRWENFYRERVPDTMSGGEFLSRFQGITDPATSVDPEKIYAVRSPTAHPIYEHQRVKNFDGIAAQRPFQDEHLDALGELMYQSHESYGRCGLGSDGTDMLVDLVKKAGKNKGLFGAKITGGGSGGTVAVLGRRGSRQAVEEVVRRYRRQSGRSSMIVEGSSPGAVPFGVVKMIPERP